MKSLTFEAGLRYLTRLRLRYAIGNFMKKVCYACTSITKRGINLRPKFSRGFNSFFVNLLKISARQINEV